VKRAHPEYYKEMKEKSKTTTPAATNPFELSKAGEYQISCLINLKKVSYLFMLGMNTK
jgi:hypothetical protein